MSPLDAGKPRALEGLRVLDVGTFIAAPFCASLLAEFGADVIKVEDPRAGDSLRRLAGQDQGHGLWWLQENRGKRAVTIDLRQPKGQALFRRLAAAADIVVENFRPGTLERWGLGYERLSADNPGLILVRISGYGQTGPAAPKAGFGRTAQAFGGLTYLAGYPDRPPVLPGSTAIADYLAGLFGATALLTAKIYRDRTGLGQVIDVSLFESVLRVLDTLTIDYDRLGIVRERSPFDAPHSAPHCHYPTRDGRWVAIACPNDKAFAQLCKAMNEPQLIEDPRFATVETRVQHRREIDQVVTTFTASMEARDLVELLDAHDVPSSPINSIVDIMADPHVIDRGSIIEVMHEQLGAIRMPCVVPRLSRTPGTVEYAGRAKGADTDDVLGGLLGLSEAELEALRQDAVI